MAKDSNGRDWLDYTDLIVKILSGGVLVIVSFLVSTSNQLKQQEIDNSLKYGEFTKSLMENLLAKDTTHFKSDVALITLNRTIGDKNPKLIADLGARIIEDFLEDKVNSDRSTMRSIIAIVKERDTTTFNEVKVLIDGYSQLHATAKVESIKSKKDSSTLVLNKITDHDWDKITLLKSTATVFIQVNKDIEEQDPKNKSLVDELKGSGFNIPAIEVVNNFNFKNTIRYYYSADKVAAEKVQRIVSNKLGYKPALIKINNTKAKMGLIELWCNI